MINLLPPDYAASIKYGRLNTKLRRWLVGMMAAIFGLIAIMGTGWLFLNNQSKSLQNDINLGQLQLNAQHLSQVQKDAAEISADVKVIDKVLSQEINFSSLMQDIGKIMPPGTILSGINLTKVDGAIDLNATTKDYPSAAQVAVNLSDPKNNLFSSIDIVNINCTNANSDYRCSASYKALFNKDAKSQYLGATVKQ